MSELKVANVIFKIEKKPNVQIVSWSIEGTVLDYRDLEEIDEFVREVLVDHIDTSLPTILSGRAPHWFYNVLVHNLHFVRLLAIFEPRLKLGIIIVGPPDYIGDGLDPETGEIVVGPSLGAKGKLRVVPVILREGSESPIQVVATKIVGDRFIDPSELKNVHITISKLKEEGKVVSDLPIIIYGLMPIWLGQFIFVQLVHFCPFISMFDPRIGGGIVTATHQVGVHVGDVIELSEEELEKINTVLEKKVMTTKVIAIAGAPNSGKSVFLHLLNNALREMGYITLTQEAELFSPTQEWSLYAPELRRKLKREVSPEERLEWIIRSLETARTRGGVDFILVDLGGGIEENGELIRYCTRENLAILRYVDYVVICSRNDREQINRIYTELSEYVPWITIVATLESIYPDPEGEHAWWDEECRCGAVSHLDREAYAKGEIPEKTIQIARRVAELIVEQATSE